MNVTQLDHKSILWFKIDNVKPKNGAKIFFANRSRACLSVQIAKHLRLNIEKRFVSENLCPFLHNEVMIHQ